MIDKNFVRACQAFIEPNRFRLDEPMKLHTTFKIGGPADCLIFPASMEETEKVLALVNEYKLPLTILGNGSNVLVQDKGIRGVVVKFARPMAKIRHEGTRIIAGAGALLKDVSEAAAQSSLTGLEFACGIPGSIGGAIFMNAGAYDGEMKNVADTVRTVDREGRIHTYSRDELDLGYRHSRFQDNGEAIVEVELSLEPGDSKAIRAKMDDFTQRRESKQPLEMPSAGSTFKRPKGYFAGTLIQETGLKGLQVGGAQVSTKHAGFVVNATGNATAADVRGLIHEVQQRVYQKHGVMLHPEVRIIGDA
ncbi:UDP-N-acetylmuramate dehydrogenase [Mitsuokella jalaludinii]|uniref:UDP-N-acetylenolpyruvoylglucosamine reductase n=1 Tax=Mitsuokella jalaludinii TaxID=187979 RepID=A0A173XMM9_9FIRM|nr:UDP-N-acetylmuramate dehydrogenase [Mitsuokella jalaludinii]CUN52949.1 UDP-N-acetylenolpyruvoylglucosamine reductase [Mitsuokella jalaludinii]